MARKVKLIEDNDTHITRVDASFVLDMIKEDLYYIKEKEALKEVNQIINNVCLHNVSNSLCNSET